LALNFNLYSVNYIWYLKNAEQQYNKRDELQRRGKGEVDGKNDRVVNDKQEDRGQPTETTTDKGAERESGSSNDISSSENSQQVKT
jgi:hypothetical protein